MRSVIGVSITGTRSKTEFERQSLTIIERQVEILLALEARLKQDQPSTDRELANLIAMAVKDVENPEHKEVSFLEAKLGESVALLSGPQPVVAALDKMNGGSNPF